MCVLPPLSPSLPMRCMVCDAAAGAEPPTGNQVGVVATDLAHKILVESCVVACKMNPVNEYQGPLLEHIFAPLVRARAPLVRPPQQCASGRERLLSSRVRFRVRATGRWTRALCSSCTAAARCACHHSHHST